MESSSQPPTLPCDVVLLPDSPQAELAVQASRALTSQGSLFTLDNRQFYAHASLYMFQMDAASQDDCIAALRQLASETSVQQLDQGGYFYQDAGHGKGYVDVTFERNDEVDALQARVVAVFNELRAGMRESDKQKMADATGTKLKNLQEYGYPAIGELFRPHITLAKFPVDVEPDLSVLSSAADFDGTFTRLGLFEMGQNGTCIRKIAEFGLSGMA